MLQKTSEQPWEGVLLKQPTAEQRVFKSKTGGGFKAAALVVTATLRFWGELVGILG